MDNPLGLCVLCSKLLPIILLEFPKIFTYYSFMLSLLFQNIILRRYTCVGNTSFKIVEVKSLVLAANFEKVKVRYDCSIGVSEHSIRVYQSFITTFIVSGF